MRDNDRYQYYTTPQPTPAPTPTPTNLTKRAHTHDTSNASASDTASTSEYQLPRSKRAHTSTASDTASTSKYQLPRYSKHTPNPRPHSSSVKNNHHREISSSLHNGHSIHRKRDITSDTQTPQYYSTG